MCFKCSRARDPITNASTKGVSHTVDRSTVRDIGDRHVRTHEQSRPDKSGMLVQHVNKGESGGIEERERIEWGKGRG